MLAVPEVFSNGVMGRRLAPGDILAGGEVLASGAITTTGSTGTWTAAAIASGIITRTGASATYTDTTDTAANIIAALAGNQPAPDGVVGQSFRMKFINTVAFAHTFAAGAGVVAGTGGSAVLNTGTSAGRDYLVTILNATPPITVTGTTVASSTTVTFALPAGMLSLPIGPSPLSYNITGGMTATGTGIAASTTVTGLVAGVGGNTGMILSGTATASGVVPITLGPTVRFDGLGAFTL